jgi:hypothetical protein
MFTIIQNGELPSQITAAFNSADASKVQEGVTRALFEKFSNAAHSGHFFVYGDPGGSAISATGSNGTGNFQLYSLPILSQQKEAEISNRRWSAIAPKAATGMEDVSEEFLYLWGGEKIRGNDSEDYYRIRNWQARRGAPKSAIAISGLEKFEAWTNVQSEARNLRSHDYWVDVRIWPATSSFMFAPGKPARIEATLNVRDQKTGKVERIGLDAAKTELLLLKYFPQSGIRRLPIIDAK